MVLEVQSPDAALHYIVGRGKERWKKRKCCVVQRNNFTVAFMLSSTENKHECTFLFKQAASFVRGAKTSTTSKFPGVTGITFWVPGKASINTASLASFSLLLALSLSLFHSLSLVSRFPRTLPGISWERTGKGGSAWLYRTSGSRHQDSPNAVQKDDGLHILTSAGNSQAGKNKKQR